MGKFSSSSAQSKPLFILSLAASLALHAGGILLLLRHPPSFLVAKEISRVEHYHANEEKIDHPVNQAFQNLVMREEDTEESSSYGKAPQIEQGEIPLILTERETTFQVRSERGEAMELEIPSYFPSLIGEEWISSKNSPFQNKKSVNFTRKIENEGGEELAPSPYIAAGKKYEDSVDPLIEEKEEKKAFLPKDLKSKEKKELYPPSKVFSFKQPKTSSELIDRNFSYGKPSYKAPLNFDRPEVALIPSQNNEREKNSALIEPSLEALEINPFVRESHFFADYVSETSAYPFTIEEGLTDTFMELPYSVEKQPQSKNPSFATHTFNSLKWADVQEFKERKSTVEWTPSYQSYGNAWTFQFHTPDVCIESETHIVEFETGQDTLPLMQRQQEVHSKRDMSLAGQTMPHAPYLNIENREEIRKEVAYLPMREGDHPDPIRYSIPAGPSIALEIGSEVYTFTPAPSFDLFISEDGIAPPKKLQKFVASNLEVSHPYFSNDTFEALATNRPSPQLEPSNPPAFDDVALSLSSSIETVPSSFEFPKGEEDVALIGKGISFPEGKIKQRRIEIDFEETSQIASNKQSTQEEEVSLPSQESAKPTLAFQTPSLAISPSQSIVPFNTDQKDAFALQSQPPSFEKQPKKIHDALSADVLTLPNVNSKEITPRQLHEEDLSLFAQLNLQTEVELIQREKQYSNTRELLEKEQAPWDEDPIKSALALEIPGMYIESRDEDPLPFKEYSYTLPKLKSEDNTMPEKSSLQRHIAMQSVPIPRIEIETREELATTEQQYQPKPIRSERNEALPEPIHPAYYPPEVPHLALDDSGPSMIEKNFEHMKKKGDDPDGIDDLPLPYLGTKDITPGKHALPPQSALGNVPTAGVVMDLIQRDKQFSNTRALMEKEQVPLRIPTDTSIAAGEIQELDTGMIRSQAKEIVEDYNQENAHSSGMIALRQPELETGVSEETFRKLNQSSRFTQTFLTEIPPPSYLETVTYANEFETEVHYAKQEDGKGYLFALKMKPKPTQEFTAPDQNIIYVIDGSSSIKRHRFGVFKEGVERSLGYMKEGDTFNILVADAELIPMSQKSVDWNGNSRKAAKSFLSERQYRGFFINYDPFDLLEKVSQYLDPERDNVIVMITDGKNFKNFKAHKEDFQELATASKGRFSIYTATASNNNNLSMLDLLSTFNSGELMYSKTHAAFSRQLARMVRHIEHMIAKDVHIHVTDRKVETGVEFYPNQSSLPALFSDKTYTIYGTIDELKDFDLILQGRSGDKWVNIKQHITFKHAEKASHSIKRGFALQQAYVCYDYYLKKEDPFFLSEAERILNPHSIPSATQ